MDARLYQAGMADGRYTQNDSAGASTRCGADADWVVLDGCTVHIGDMANTIGGDVALCLITVTTCFCLHYACYGILLAIRTFLVSLFFSGSTFSYIRQRRQSTFSRLFNMACIHNPTMT